MRIFRGCGREKGMDSKRKGRRWVTGVLGAYGGILIVIAALVIIVDPYFHFHAPIEGISYEMKEEQYMNDGITRNFDYDTIITGDSTSLSFSTAIIDELFDAQSVRLTFQGEGFKGINENLQTAIDTHPELKLVIRGIGTLWFVTDEDYMGYDDYPDYLYDDIIWNDVYYIWNGDVLFCKVFPEIGRTLKQVPAKGFDAEIFPSGGLGDVALARYERPEKAYKKAEEQETEQMFQMLDRNLQKNVIEIIETNPDITFYLFFPPYSILWWDQHHQIGEEVLIRRIQMEQYAIEKLLPYENVHLFAFTTNTEWICDLNHYNDEVHYTESTCTQILKWMKAGEYELTEDNYMEYIECITDFMLSYDFDAIFE